MAKRPRPEMPNLSNATPEFIVDELGRVREQLKELKTLEGFYKQGLMARRADGQNVISGQYFDCSITLELQVRISADKVREYFKNDPDTLSSLQDDIEMQVIRTPRKTMSGAT